MADSSDFKELKDIMIDVKKQLNRKKWENRLALAIYMFVILIVCYSVITYDNDTSCINQELPFLLNFVSGF